MKIKKGIKLQIAYDHKDLEEKDFTMITTFQEQIDETCYLMSIPMKNGKALQITEEEKLVFKGGTGNGSIFFAGYIDETVKKGVRTFWKVRRVNEQRMVAQRSDERIDCTFRLKYWQPTWSTNFDGEIEPEEGLTINVSGGGLAMYLNDVFHVGEVCEIQFPQMGKGKAGQPIEVIGETCWNREPEKGMGFKNVCGIKFIYKDDKMKKKVQDYIENMKKYTS